jgi:hypothetical protein
VESWIIGTTRAWASWANAICAAKAAAAVARLGKRDGFMAYPLFGKENAGVFCWAIRVETLPLSVRDRQLQRHKFTESK